MQNNNIDKRTGLPKVKPEKQGFRDEVLSRRHRLWGFNCPGADIDLVFVEYTRKKVVALVEYKHWNGPIIRQSKDANLAALIDLGNRACVPVFGCRYKDDYSQYKVASLNEKAIKLLPERTKIMTEREYVEFMYSIRGEIFPPGLFDGERLIPQDDL